MRIAIGSNNPVKIHATGLAFNALWPSLRWHVIECGVDSTVSNQPMSDIEAWRGAKERARAAITSTEADYGVGLENGLQQLDGHWFDTGWAFVVDQSGREGVGTTLRMEVPRIFMKLVTEGKELGDACDLIFAREDTKRNNGFFGLMTNDTVTRTSAFRDAVISALVPFIKPAFADSPERSAT